MKKFAFLTVAAMVTLSAQAQDAVVGKLISVQGNVTVASAGQVVKAAHGTQIAANSTILVANGAKATVVLNEGCVIALQSNQHLTLNSKLTCSQQVAAVTQLFTPYRVAQAPVGTPVVVGGGAGAAGGGLLIGGAIVAGGALLIANTDTTKPSGS